MTKLLDLHAVDMFAVRCIWWYALGPACPSMRTHGKRKAERAAARTPQ